MALNFFASSANGKLANLPEAYETLCGLLTSNTLPLNLRKEAANKAIELDASSDSAHAPLSKLLLVNLIKQFSGLFTDPPNAQQMEKETFDAINLAPRPSEIFQRLDSYAHLLTTRQKTKLQSISKEQTQISASPTLALEHL
jgi:hypothetical protein